VLNDTGWSSDQLFAGECYFQAKEIEVFSIALSIPIKHHFIRQTKTATMSVMGICIMIK
jgi:hypothetical protein